MRYDITTAVSLLRRPAGAFVLVLACVLVFAVVYSMTHRVPTPPVFVAGERGSADVQQAYWKGRVEALGGVAAYAEFSRWASDNAVVGQHALAHAFGAALYEVEGVSAVAVCDTQFSYGCFHVVLGKAIAEHGLSKVDMLDDVCRRSIVTSPEGCEHGIGHGIATYLGYTYDALTRALEVCSSMSQTSAIPGCLSGVFMEYNTRTMLAGLLSLRPVVAGNVLAPCDTLAPVYQKTCVFWQPQWWMHGMYDGQVFDELLYQKLGALCDRVGSSALVRSCYQGLGNITPESAGYSPAPSAMLCRASSTSALDQLYCLSFAAQVIGDYRGHEEGRHVCNDLKGSALEYCTDYANGKANLFHPDAVPPPESL